MKLSEFQKIALRNLLNYLNQDKHYCKCKELELDTTNHIFDSMEVLNKALSIADARKRYAAEPIRTLEEFFVEQKCTESNYPDDRMIANSQEVQFM